MKKNKGRVLKYLCSWMRKDSKRIIFLLGIPVFFVLISSRVNFSLLGLSLKDLHSQLATGLLFGVISFIGSFYIRFLKKRRAISKPSLLVLLFFSFYLFFINAFAEELFFRGFLQSILSELLDSSILSLGLTSLVFSYYHIPVFGWSKKEVFLVFIGGLFFGTIFFYTKSLLAVWIVHALGDLGLFFNSGGNYLIWTKSE